MKLSVFFKISGMLFLFLHFNSYSQDPIDVSDEIMTANESFMEALQAGDAETIVAHYTDKARVMPPNLPLIEGKDNIRDMWKANLASGPMNLKGKTVTAEAFGGTAIEEGAYKILTPDGQIVDHGKYIVIWKKVDGTWKLHQDIFNSNQPPRGTGM